MTDAVKAYEEKARDQWLFDYPAQVSLCGTQIWWTSEVKLPYLCHLEPTLKKLLTSLKNKLNTYLFSGWICFQQT